jgi:hypothetical protein
MVIVDIKPVFPAEIDRIIFLLAAQFPGSIPTFMLVAFRVHKW